MSTQAAITSLAASCAALLLAACGGGGGHPPQPPASSEGQPPSPSPPPREKTPPEPPVPRAETASEQRARSTGIVSRANSLVASSLSEQRGSAGVIDYQPSCNGTACTFSSPAETLPVERLGENYSINLANPVASNESLLTKHDITLIQSTWSSADLRNPSPSENVNYTVFGAWMEQSVFFTDVIRGQLAGYNSNRTMAGSSERFTTHRHRHLAGPHGGVAPQRDKSRPKAPGERLPHLQPDQPNPECRLHQHP